ncbi:MAG: phospholipase D-like domain-containing protein [Myxococcota bacterium]|nr:phospholipase D-like domain-containing protein [Myxococcota bacterium]
MTQLLIPGLTCATTFPGPRSGVLVDGRDFYKALFDACCKAQRSILMTGWQFDSKVELLRGEDAADCARPTRLVDFLRDLCEARPDLDIYMLAWDASPVFAFEREPLQRLMFQLRGHKRIHYKMDNKHPTGASHHQKLVLVDRAIAFVGGMDVCNSRWDDRAHAADAPDRCSGSRSYAPYHDVQAYVTGDAVDVLRTWFCERWVLATGKPLDLPEVAREEIEITPSFPVDAPRIGLTRTLPRTEDPPSAPVLELYELHLRAIAAAERLIYIENQYLSCDEISDALVHRMEKSCDPPLEIVILLPEKSAGFKERISIGVYQQRILERLGAVAERTGHHLGVYYHCACGKDGEVPVFIHAKVLAVDDRFLLVSSANTSNRSMGFDTELGLAWEAPEATESLKSARIDLLGEHVGVEGAEADTVLGSIGGLVGRLDDLARAKSHHLRLHARNVDEKPGWFLSKFIPDETPFDPDDPRSFEDALPEPGVWLDRLFRDPFMLVSNARRGFRKHRNRLKA